MARPDNAGVKRPFLRSSVNNTSRNLGFTHPFGYIVSRRYSKAPDHRENKGVLTLAAKVFQIIGIVALVLFVPIGVIVLYMAGRLLKKVNRSLRERAGGIRKQVDASLSGIDAAQDQLAALSTVSASVKAGMDKAIEAADKAVGFLKSAAFQAGLPAAIWVIFLAVTLPRGLVKRRKKKKSKVEPIPPPSWEKEES